VGGNVRGALTAFAVSDGAVKWSWTGDGPGYASPIAATLAGVPQIVTQSRNHIIGVSASDGRLLWKFPFTTEYVQNIVTPLVYRDTLILSGINKGVFAVRVVKKGAAYEAEKVWENQDAALYMNSPVLHGDFVYGLSHKNRGQYFCLDARDGKLQWSTPGREGENAAILLAGNTLLLLNNDAALIVAKATSQAYTELQRYKVADSATWAHPALSNRGILIKDHSTLAFWRFE
jgi:outer membrane protein assembly factor BamB